MVIILGIIRNLFVFSAKSEPESDDVQLTMDG